MPDETREWVEPIMLPTVLTRDNLDDVLHDYLRRVETIRFPYPECSGMDLMEALDSAILCGPHPAMGWQQSFSCIRKDLVMLFGVRALFHYPRFPFDNYAIEIEPRRNGFMSRLGDAIVIGSAVTADTWRSPSRRYWVQQKLRRDPDPEVMHRVVLIESVAHGWAEPPRLHNDETLGWVDIRNGWVQFMDGPQ